MPHVPNAPGQNEKEALHDKCECGASLVLFFRDQLVGEDVVLRGDPDSNYRCEVISFTPTTSRTLASLDMSDDWQVECVECGDMLYENFA